MLTPLLTHSSHALCVHLGVDTYGTFALCAGVGADLVEALGADGLLVFLYVFLPLQVVAAVDAVQTFRHGGGLVTLGTCGDKRG